MPQMDVCRACKSVQNAISYRKKRLAGEGTVEPYAEQERKILLHALSVTHGDERRLPAATPAPLARRVARARSRESRSR